MNGPSENISFPSFTNSQSRPNFCQIATPLKVVNDSSFQSKHETTPQIEDSAATTNLTDRSSDSEELLLLTDAPISQNQTLAQYQLDTLTMLFQQQLSIDYSMINLNSWFPSSIKPTHPEQATVNQIWNKIWNDDIYKHPESNIITLQSISKKCSEYLCYSFAPNKQIDPSQLGILGFFILFNKGTKQKLQSAFQNLSDVDSYKIFGFKVQTSI